MFPLCFPRADDPPPPRKPFRSRVVDASSFLSRAAAFRGGGVRWRVSPGGGVGCAIGCRSEKKRMRLVRKTSFCFFLPKKKPQKKRAKERYFTTQTSFQHRTPKRDAPRTKKPPPGRNGNGRRRSERASSIERADSFENPSLDAGRHRPERRPASSSRAFFL